MLQSYHIYKYYTVRCCNLNIQHLTMLINHVKKEKRKKEKHETLFKIYVMEMIVIVVHSPSMYMHIHIFINAHTHTFTHLCIYVYAYTKMYKFCLRWCLDFLWKFYQISKILFILRGKE